MRPREQAIRHEKTTANICTNQSLRELRLKMPSGRIS
ncbi:MAG: hypothetical protein KC553_06045 [Nitrospina sp.]|nr:hypothetical protein [Nitrospina sp.]